MVIRKKKGRLLPKGAGNGFMGALDIGIDLGTTKVIIYQPGKGELLHEPAVISVDTRNL